MGLFPQLSEPWDLAVPFSGRPRRLVVFCDLGVVDGIFGMLVSARPLFAPLLRYPAPFCSLLHLQRMSYDW